MHDTNKLCKHLKGKSILIRGRTKTIESIAMFSGSLDSALSVKIHNRLYRIFVKAQNGSGTSKVFTPEEYDLEQLRDYVSEFQNT